MCFEQPDVSTLLLRYKGLGMNCEVLLGLCLGLIPLVADQEAGSHVCAGFAHDNISCARLTSFKLQDDQAK